MAEENDVVLTELKMETKVFLDNDKAKSGLIILNKLVREGWNIAKFKFTHISIIILLEREY